MISIAILVPIVIALTEAVKRAKFLDKKMMPFMAMAMAIVLAGATKHTGELWTDALILGITVGLSAVGLFEGIKGGYRGLTKK